jgi:hypothetical protein
MVERGTRGGATGVGVGATGALGGGTEAGCDGDEDAGAGCAGAVFAAGRRPNETAGRPDFELSLLQSCIPRFSTEPRLPAEPTRRHHAVTIFDEALGLVPPMPFARTKVDGAR